MHLFFLQKIVGPHHFEQKFMSVIGKKKGSFCEKNRQKVTYNQSHMIEILCEW